MKSTRPSRPAPRNGSNRSPGRKSIRPATPWAAAISRAATTARQPLPVPMSTTIGSGARFSRRNASTSPSVSGRGISTAGVTRNVRDQNSWTPVRYCSGSRAARRATSARKRPAAAATTGVSGRARRRAPSMARTWDRRSSASRRAAGPPSPPRSGRTRRSCSDTHLLLQRLRLEVRGDRLDDRIEIALQDLRQAVDGEVDAVIGETVLREIVGADLFGALSGADLAAPALRDGVALLLDLEIQQARAQDLQGADRKSTRLNSSHSSISYAVFCLK